MARTKRRARVAVSLMAGVFWASLCPLVSATGLPKSTRQAALNGADLADIRARGTLRVIFHRQGMVEAISMKPGTPPGLERELIEGFAALQRLKVEFVPVASVAERIPALLAGKGDVVGGGLIATPARRKLVDVTEEILPERHVAVTCRPQRAIESLEQLRRTRVATFKGSSWAEAVAGAGVPPGNVQDAFMGPEAVLSALHDQKVEAVVMSLGWALLERRKDPQIELGVFVGPPLSRTWGVRKDAPQLRQSLDEYISSVRRTATWSRLVVKYYGDLALEVLKKSRADP
jgi:membrane-bound lytic murein transglycosylase F